MWDYFVLAAYLFGVALNAWLAWDIWRTRGACWRLGLGLALIIIFVGLFTGKLKEVREFPTDVPQAAQAL